MMADKCPKCGATHRDWGCCQPSNPDSGFESFECGTGAKRDGTWMVQTEDCLRRQLAAEKEENKRLREANENLGQIFRKMRQERRQSAKDHEEHKRVMRLGAGIEAERDILKENGIFAERERQRLREALEAIKTIANTAPQSVADKTIIEVIRAALKESIE